MKKLFVVAIVLFIAFQTQAKESKKPADAQIVKQSCAISGKITDKGTGEEFSGVAVKIKGTETVCFTDFEGNYQFKNLPQGEIQLEVSLVSYKEVKNVKLNAGENEVHELNIKLDQLK
jgi:hypothetical protein